MAGRPDNSVCCHAHDSADGSDEAQIAPGIILPPGVPSTLLEWSSFNPKTEGGSHNTSDISSPLPQERLELELDLVRGLRLLALCLALFVLVCYSAILENVSDARLGLLKYVWPLLTWKVDNRGMHCQALLSKVKLFD